MENTKKTNKKFRNPFPAIGKVFKYEMICGARIIFPMYAILLVLSLIVGIFVMGKDLDFEAKGLLGTVKVILIILTTIMSFVLFIITISQIEKRYKRSILGDEAYLNMTLPVTVGEHLWGRYLADIVWALAYAVTGFIAILFTFIKALPDFFDGFAQLAEEFGKYNEQYGGTFGNLILMIALNALALFMLICIFAYMANTVSQLIGKHKTLIEIVIFAVSFILYTNLSDFLFRIESNVGHGSITQALMIAVLIYNIAWTAVFSVITRVILNKNLNLE
jgi:hypothetical protein